jgi:hypothetical protein
VAEREEQQQEKQQERLQVRQVEARIAPNAHVIHEVILKQGESELRRPSSALAWSALAAGLSMGFSLVAEGLLRSMLPDTEWRPLIAKFGYSLGFLIVIVGKQQLFTENTLTPIIPLMAHRDGRTLARVARLWTEPCGRASGLVGACRRTGGEASRAASIPRIGAGIHAAVVRR